MKCSFLVHNHQLFHLGQTPQTLNNLLPSIIPFEYTPFVHSNLKKAIFIQLIQFGQTCHYVTNIP